MFIAHYGLGFACKRVAPRASLGVLVAAVSLLDLIWPILLLSGMETVRIEPGNAPLARLDFVSYPYSHSLLFVVLWAAAFAGLYVWRTRYRTGALVVAAGVMSHWLLDLIVHRPDLPLYPGGPRLGLGLWGSLAGTLVAESAFFAIGVWIYVSATRATSPVGRWAWWALVVVLSASYVANLVGPPPPDAHAVALAGMLTWLFPVWAWWIDRHRRAIQTSNGVPMQQPGR